jgi:hypothetical protein
VAYSRNSELGPRSGGGEDAVVPFKDEGDWDMGVIANRAGHALRPFSAFVKEAPTATDQPPRALKDLVSVLLLFVALRGLLFGFVFYGKALSHWGPAYPYVYPSMKMEGYWYNWTRWDSDWYRDVLLNGYTLEPKQQAGRTNVAFFPLFPYAVGATSVVLGGVNHWTAGLLITNLATAFSLFFILRIARRFLDEDGARRSLVYLLLFPGSFFFSAYYTEGLFLLTTSASIYYYLEKRYFLCGVWGYLAAMTRDPGVLLFPSFVLGWFWDRRGRIGWEDLRMLWLLLIPAGLLTFMGILYAQVGDPLAFLHAHESWDRRPTFFPVTIWNGLQAIDWSFPNNERNMLKVLDCVTGIGFLVLPFFLFRKVDKAVAIYALLGILMPLSSGGMSSMIRFSVVLFPSFFVLAQWGENRRVDRLIVSASAMFLGLLTLGFTNWYFIG